MATIYFDLDGTLTDCRPRHYRLYSDICAELGIRTLSPGRYWTLRRRGASTPSLIRNASEGLRADFLERWIERIESAEYVALDQPLPRAAETLEGLKKAHKLMLVTLRRRNDTLLKQLDRAGLAPSLDAMVCPNGHVPESKAQLLEAPAPGEGFVVGDTEADIQLANDIGGTSIAVLSGVRGRRYLEAAGADYVIASVRALPALVRTLAS